MTAAGWIDDQRAGRVGTAEIDLRAVKNVDVFIALMQVQGDARSRRVLQKGRRWSAFTFPVQTVDIHARPIGSPGEIGSENPSG